jgi:ABC-2 type transport system permease protein
MNRFIATVRKELRLLRRDRTGLLVLFVMPAVLVTVITLVQNNAMKSLGADVTNVLFVDEDLQAVAQHIEKALAATGTLRLVKRMHDRPLDRATALAAVSRGECQVAVVIPRGLTAAVQAAARHSVQTALGLEEARQDPETAGTVSIELHFDPALLGGVRSAIMSHFRLLALEVEMEEKMAALSQWLPVKIGRCLAAARGPMAAGPMPAGMEGIDLKWDPHPVLPVTEARTPGQAPLPVPNAVQQNVPAWSLFGIFFIVLPLAGSFIKERLCGVQYRLLSMPVTYLTVAAGKMSAYMLVCLVQYALILAIAKWLLPLLGAPRFEIGGAPVALVVVCLSATLAATGYGVLLGTTVRSFEQASMFGPISVVISAALGGIMVPVYAMPAFMQKLSQISPMGWAQKAFLDLLVRNEDLTSVLPDVLLLLLFGLACIGAAWFVFMRDVSRGRI